MREHRKQRKLNQERVAEALGIAKSTLSEMESGKIELSLERWLSWCAVLRISPSDVLRKWELSEEFAEVSIQRKESYYKIVDLAIKHGLGAYLDSVLSYIQALLEAKKIKNQYQTSRRLIRDLHPRKSN